MQLARLSLDDVAPCKYPQNTTVVANSTVQVLQTRRYAYTQVYQCLIVVRQLIFTCGAFSHASIAREGYRDYVHTVTADECKKIHEASEVLFKGHHLEVTKNSTTSMSLLIAGSVDNDGNCEGVSYHDGGHSYNGVTVTASIKLR